MILHYEDNFVFFLQVALIALMLCPVLVFIITRAWRVPDVDEFKVTPIETGRRKKRRILLRGWDAVLATMGGCVLVNFVINMIANLSLGIKKFALAPIEIYLFYSAIAVAETITFCILVVAAITWIAAKLGITSEHGPNVVASIISGLLFSGAHSIDLIKLVFEGKIEPGVYASVPAMLWATGVAGFSMAMFFAYTKNPLVPTAAHVINNLIAASFVLSGQAVMYILTILTILGGK